MARISAGSGRCVAAPAPYISSFDWRIWKFTETPKRRAVARSQSISPALSRVMTALRKKSRPSRAHSSIARITRRQEPAPRCPSCAASRPSIEITSSSSRRTMSIFCGMRKPFVTIAARMPRRRTSSTSSPTSGRSRGSPPRSLTRTVPSRANSARSFRCSSVESWGSFAAGGVAVDHRALQPFRSEYWTKNGRTVPVSRAARIWAPIPSFCEGFIEWPRAPCRGAPSRPWGRRPSAARAAGPRGPGAASAR